MNIQFILPLLFFVFTVQSYPSLTQRLEVAHKKISEIKNNINSKQFNKATCIDEDCKNSCDTIYCTYSCTRQCDSDCNIA